MPHIPTEVLGSERRKTMKYKKHHSLTHIPSQAEICAFLACVHEIKSHGRPEKHVEYLL
jgi:hypothetical protein